MNKQRRQRIETVLNELTQQVSEIESLQAEEQEAYDALPEGLQEAERGESMYEAAQALEEAGGLLSEVIDLLEQSKDA